MSLESIFILGGYVAAVAWIFLRQIPNREQPFNIRGRIADWIAHAEPQRDHLYDPQPSAPVPLEYGKRT